MDAVEVKPALGWLEATAQWFRSGLAKKSGEPRIGLALGGGFARGIAHIGVLRALEKNNIPIHAVAGVSSGAIVAAAMASGSSADEIQQIALSMKFRDIARWTVNLLGLAGNDRMITFLGRLLKTNRFEEMQDPPRYRRDGFGEGPAGYISHYRRRDSTHPGQLRISGSVSSVALSGTDSGGWIREHGSARCAVIADGRRPGDFGCHPQSGRQWGLRQHVFGGQPLLSTDERAHGA